VPMWGENRILVHYGLRQINEDPRPGIRALIESCNLGYGDLTAQQIVFVMAPRINAVGRMGDAKRAVDLLTCEDFTRAQEYAQVLEEENRNRRKIDEVTFQEAQQHAAAYLAEDPSRPIVLHSDSWHPGVIGIVASRLVEKFHRPTVLLTTAPDGLAKGSARSILEFNIYEALQRCEHLLEQFGGHPFAAGLVLKVENLPAFRDCFSKAAAGILNADMLTHRIELDAELRLTDITPRFWRMLKEFAPFGPKNQRPVFLTRNCEVFGTPRTVGANNAHLKMKVRQDGIVFDCIGYNLGARLAQLQGGAGTRVDILFTIEENTRSGNVFQQLRLRDIRSSSDPRTPADLPEVRDRNAAPFASTPAVAVTDVSALAPAAGGNGADAAEASSETLTH
jgi:single-stranded-DNA-specific exonuclease